MRNASHVIYIMAAALLTLPCACSQQVGEDVANQPGTDVSGQVDTGSSGGVGDSGAVDAGPKVCVPGCKIWQVCTDGICKNKACTDDKACNPAGGPAAGDKPHYCYKGKCALFQCGKDEDCKGGQVCNTLTSLCYTKNTGCAHDADCVDKDPCTADTCVTKTGKCVHKLAFGCCKTAKDCDDGSLCTDDACDPKTSKCAYTSKPKCCTSDGNCADNSSCTVDTCDKATGSCKFTLKKDCCDDDGQCDDDDALTKDSCAKGKCVHAMTGMPTTCKAAGDCKANKCVTATCVSGACSFAKKAGATGCCDKDSACTMDKKCHVNACVGHVCAATPTAQESAHTWYRFDDSGLNGWTVAKGNKTAYFHFYTGHKVSGAGALRYGVPGKKTWSGGFPNEGSVTSGEITLATKTPYASFYVWFDGEPSAGVHQFGLQVVQAGKATDVWTKNKDLKGNTGGAWKAALVDLKAYAGKKVQLRFWFDVAVKFPKEDGHGLVIDQLEVGGACP